MERIQTEPLLVVANVPASSQFYQRLLLCESAHGGEEYEMLVQSDRLLLQLHHQDAHEHPELWQPGAAGVPAGNGVALWFRTDDFPAAVARVRELAAPIVAGPHVNPNAQQDEIWLRDPDGYLVVLSNSPGDAN